MTIKFAFASMILSVAAALSACTQGPFDNPPLGEATKQNFAVQVIDPRPAPTALAPDMDGNVAATALQRYKTGKVVVPVPEATDSAN